MQPGSPVYERPIELLQKLIRFDTTNPPGNEAACVCYIRDLLEGAGIPCTLLALDPARPNLVARVKGQGNAPPLLLQGHADVVSAADQAWSRDPFGGEVADGFVWGRGSLDMKGGLAMMLAALLKAHAEGLPLPGDVVLAVVADEEAGGDYGAKFLTEQHPELFEGIRFALGEFGGFALVISGKRYYPIMVGEKQLCWLKVTVRGPGGHGSMPLKGGAMAKLGRLLRQLDATPLPVRITPAARQMIAAMASGQAGVRGLLMRTLLNPATAGQALRLLGDKGAMFRAVLANTVSPTIIRGGDKINVHPAAVSVALDGRLLPGCTPDDIVKELRGIIGPEPEIEVNRYDSGPPEPDMGLFKTLGDILREADPEGIPLPLLFTAVTDARFFAQLGIQTYGFTPMVLPPDLPFTQLAHGADERIPVEAVDFGTQAILKALQRFGEAE